MGGIDVQFSCSEVLVAGTYFCVLNFLVVAFASTVGYSARGLLSVSGGLCLALALVLPLSMVYSPSLAYSVWVGYLCFATAEDELIDFWSAHRQTLQHHLYYSFFIASIIAGLRFCLHLRLTLSGSPVNSLSLAC
jgi:hypothetical protein